MTGGPLATREVCELTGLTYRQLDYLCRLIGWSPGTGVRRRWFPIDLRPLLIAQALATPYGEWGHHQTIFPRIARAVISGPAPPATGWVAYLADNVTYGATPAEALGPLVGAIVAKIPEQPL